MTQPIVPPHNLQVEQALLGALMLKPVLIDDVLSVVNSDDFYQPSHGRIYQAIVETYDAAAQVDLATVGDCLSRKGELESIGGPGAIMSILTDTPVSDHAPTYARKVREYAKLRQLFATAQAVQSLVVGNADTDSLELLDKVEAEWSKLRDAAPSQVVTAHQAMEHLWNELDERLENKGAIKSPMGWPDLDKMTGGLKDGVLYVIGARPGVGKSSFAAQLALNTASRNQPVLFCSMEMNETEVMSRMAGAEAGVVYKKIDEGTINQDEYQRLQRVTDSLGQLPIAFDDSPAQSLFDIKSAARKLRRDRGALGLVLVDYLQLMKPARGISKPEYRQQEVSTIVRGLKELARELSVHVVALSQMNRGIEGRAVPRPRLSDLRESGEIEQAANVIMFIHRETDLDGLVVEPFKAEIIVAKNRGGPIGSTFLHVDLAKAQWRSLTRSYQDGAIR